MEDIVSNLQSLLDAERVPPLAFSIPRRAPGTPRLHFRTPRGSPRSARTPRSGRQQGARDAPTLEAVVVSSVRTEQSPNPVPPRSLVYEQCIEVDEEVPSPSTSQDRADHLAYHGGAAAAGGVGVKARETKQFELTPRRRQAAGSVAHSVSIEVYEVAPSVAPDGNRNGRTYSAATAAVRAAGRHPLEVGVGEGVDDEDLDDSLPSPASQVNRAADGVPPPQQHPRRTRREIADAKLAKRRANRERVAELGRLMGKCEAEEEPAARELVQKEETGDRKRLIFKFRDTARKVTGAKITEETQTTPTSATPTTKALAVDHILLEKERLRSQLLAECEAQVLADRLREAEVEILHKEAQLLRALSPSPMRHQQCQTDVPAVDGTEKRLLVRPTLESRNDSSTITGSSRRNDDRGAGAELERQSQATRDEAGADLLHEIHRLNKLLNEKEEEIESLQEHITHLEVRLESQAREDSRDQRHPHQPPHHSHQAGGHWVPAAAPSTSMVENSSVASFDPHSADDTDHQFAGANASNRGRRRSGMPASGATHRRTRSKNADTSAQQQRGQHKPHRNRDESAYDAGHSDAFGIQEDDQSYDEARDKNAPKVGAPNAKRNTSSKKPAESVNTSGGQESADSPLEGSTQQRSDQHQPIWSSSRPSQPGDQEIDSESEEDEEDVEEADEAAGQPVDPDVDSEASESEGQYEGGKDEAAEDAEMQQTDARTEVGAGATTGVKLVVDEHHPLFQQALKKEILRLQEVFDSQIRCLEKGITEKEKSIEHLAKEKVAAQESLGHQTLQLKQKDAKINQLERQVTRLSSELQLNAEHLLDDVESLQNAELSRKESAKVLAHVKDELSQTAEEREKVQKELQDLRRQLKEGCSALKSAGEKLVPAAVHAVAVAASDLSSLVDVLAKVKEVLQQHRTSRREHLALDLPTKVEQLRQKAFHIYLVHQPNQEKIANLDTIIGQLIASDANLDRFLLTLVTKYGPEPTHDEIEAAKVAHPTLQLPAISAALEQVISFAVDMAADSSKEPDTVRSEALRVMTEASNDTRVVLDVLLDHIVGVEQRLIDTVQHLEQTATEKAALQTELAATSEKVTQLEKHVDELSTNLAQTTEQCRCLENDLRSVKLDLLLSQQQAQCLEEQLSASKAQVEAAQQHIEALQTENASLSENLSDANTQIGNLTEEGTKLKETVAELEVANGALNEKLDAAESRVQRLKEMVEQRVPLLPSQAMNQAAVDINNDAVEATNLVLEKLQRWNCSVPSDNRRVESSDAAAADPEATEPETEPEPTETPIPVSDSDWLESIASGPLNLIREMVGAFIATQHELLQRNASLQETESQVKQLFHCVRTSCAKIVSTVVQDEVATRVGALNSTQSNSLVAEEILPTLQSLRNNFSSLEPNADGNKEAHPLDFPVDEVDEVLIRQQFDLVEADLRNLMQQLLQKVAEDIQTESSQRQRLNQLQMSICSLCESLVPQEIRQLQEQREEAELELEAEEKDEESAKKAAGGEFLSESLECMSQAISRSETDPHGFELLCEEDREWLKATFDMVKDPLALTLQVALQSIDKNATELYSEKRRLEALLLKVEKLSDGLVVGVTKDLMKQVTEKVANATGEAEKPSEESEHQPKPAPPSKADALKKDTLQQVLRRIQPRPRSHSIANRSSSASYAASLQNHALSESDSDWLEENFLLPSLHVKAILNLLMDKLSLLSNQHESVAQQYASEQAETAEALEMSQRRLSNIMSSIEELCSCATMESVEQLTVDPADSCPEVDELVADWKQRLVGLFPTERSQELQEMRDVRERAFNLCLVYSPDRVADAEKAGFIDRMIESALTSGAAIESVVEAIIEKCGPEPEEEAVAEAKNRYPRRRLPPLPIRALLFAQKHHTLSALDTEWMTSLFDLLRSNLSTVFDSCVSRVRQATDTTQDLQEKMQAACEEHEAEESQLSEAFHLRLEQAMRDQRRENAVRSAMFAEFSQSHRTKAVAELEDSLLRTKFFWGWQAIARTQLRERKIHRLEAERSELDLKVTLQREELDNVHSVAGSLQAEKETFDDQHKEILEENDSQRKRVASLEEQLHVEREHHQAALKDTVFQVEASELAARLATKKVERTIVWNERMRIQRNQFFTRFFTKFCRSRLQFFLPRSVASAEELVRERVFHGWALLALKDRLGKVRRLRESEGELRLALRNLSAGVNHQQPAPARSSSEHTRERSASPPAAPDRALRDQNAALRKSAEAASRELRREQERAARLQDEVQGLQRTLSDSNAAYEELLSHAETWYAELDRYHQLQRENEEEEDAFLRRGHREQTKRSSDGIPASRNDQVHPGALLLPEPEGESSQDRSANERLFEGDGSPARAY